jgi:2-keto-3-deoxy-L-fuconate dehydrogenase
VFAGAYDQYRSGAKMNRLNGKTAVITAAAQGIGRATAEAFLDEGARVIAVDIQIDALQSLQGAIVRQVDVTDAQAVKALAEEFPDTNVLYNCAGFVHAGTILECDEQAWVFSLNLNVTAMYRMIRAFLPAMLQRGQGSIINMSSIASSIKGIPNRFAYTTTKAAVIGLTKSVAADYVTQGIRCNAICPGTVDTPSLRGRLAATGDFDKAYADFCARQALGRLGRVDELASLAVYLASDESSFTTGQTHIIDGGWIN